MKQLDPKARWLFFLSSFIGVVILWIILYIGIEIALLGNIGKPVSIKPGTPFLGALFLFFLIHWFWTIILPLLSISLIWSQLAYSYYKYELREDGFRKEHGVIWKKYVTIPYERIQNVDIYRGILARLLGLSDLNIQTAGMSSTVGSYGGASEGRLPGLSIEEAEKLRDELIKRARGSKNKGL